MTERPVDREFVCSCGARLSPAEVEAHAREHGLDVDTYVGAELRRRARGLSDLPRRPRDRRE